MLDSSKYREFHDETEVEAWAWKYYKDFLEMSPESRLYKIFYAYTGNASTPINNILRENPPYGTPEYFECDPKDLREYYDIIPEIVAALNHYETPENIVAYRFMHRNALKYLCGTRWIRSGLNFSDKAFLSTTLLPQKLVEFRRSRRTDCLLKLYLPKGIPGAYVSFRDKFDLHEYEFLLPPNVKFKIIKVRIFARPIIVECVLQPN